MERENLAGVPETVPVKFLANRLSLYHLGFSFRFFRDEDHVTIAELATF